MTTLSARFTQSPSEVKRYMLDYTLQLASGETVTGVTATVSSLTGAPVSPTFVINSIAIAPGALQVAFYAEGGVDQNSYEVQFIATTNIGQELEDVVQFDVKSKL